MGLLCASDAGEIGVLHEVERFARGRERFCGAQYLLSLGVDEKGNLQKCWEDVDKPEHSFGTAGHWEPKDPIMTADRPDNLTKYLDTVLPNLDRECSDCVWLPTCAGGCPGKRLYYKKDCVPFKDTPEKYVLALINHLEKEKDDSKTDNSYRYDELCPKC